MWQWTCPRLVPSWLLETPTDARRDNWFALASGVEVITNHEVFTVITVDDVGPCDRQGLSSVTVSAKEDGNIDIHPVISGNKKKFATVLFKGKVFWFEHDWLEFCTLIT